MRTTSPNNRNALRQITADVLNPDEIRPTNTTAATIRCMEKAEASS